MADELIDIYDQSNQFTHTQAMKSEAHKKGLWHRASHIWIYNSKGEILLQLRAKEKNFFPDMWDISAAGHVSAGEEPIVSGLRELEEEIGLKVKQEDLQFFKIRKASSTYKEIKNNEFYYIYFLFYGGDVTSLKLQEEEVQEVRFFTISEIKRESKIYPDKFVPHDDYWYEIFDEVEKKVRG